VLDWLRLSPLAPVHYLTYHKAFHFDVSLLLALGGSRVTQTTKCFAKAGIVRAKQRSAGGEATASPHRSVVKQRLLGLLKRFS